eukprot:763860-Hanusia_phi.AAC.5
MRWMRRTARAGGGAGVGKGGGGVEEKWGRRAGDVCMVSARQDSGGEGERSLPQLPREDRRSDLPQDGGADAAAGQRLQAKPASP